MSLFDMIIFDITTLHLIFALFISFFIFCAIMLTIPPPAPLPPQFLAPLPFLTQINKSNQDPHFPALAYSPLQLGGSHNISLEILNGTDEKIDVGDFMQGSRMPGELLDIHAPMEKKHRI